MMTALDKFQPIRLSLFDVLFERAIQEAEICTKHMRTIIFEEMEYSQDEIDFFEKVRLNDGAKLTETAVNCTKSLVFQSIADLHKRFLIYVYKVQSDAYHALLEKNGIDIDNKNCQYNPDLLVECFVKCYPISTDPNWLR